MTHVMIYDKVGGSLATGITTAQLAKSLWAKSFPLEAEMDAQLVQDDRFETPEFCVIREQTYARP
jgi:hypothetical protein